MYIMIYSLNLSPSQLVTYVVIDTPTFPPQRSINCHSRHFNFLYQFLFFFFVFLVKISSDVTQVFFSMFSFSTVERKTSIIQSIKCIILQIRLKVDHRERCVFFFLGIFAVHLKKLGALWISLHLLTAQLYNDNENTAWQQKPCNGKSSQIDFHTIEDWTESNGYKVVKQHLKRNIKHNTCFGKWSVGM